MGYFFRREDNDEVVEVPFEVMMTQDVAGYIELEDGAKARRVPSGEAGTKLIEAIPIGGGREIVSDALGFTEQQFHDFEQDRVKNGFGAVRFERDPAVPQFFRVCCSSRAVWDRYVEHRGLFDKNHHSGTAITADELKRAKTQADRSVENRQREFAAAGLS